MNLSHFWWHVKKGIGEFLPYRRLWRAQSWLLACQTSFSAGSRSSTCKGTPGANKSLSQPQQQKQFWCWPWSCSSWSWRKRKHAGVPSRLACTCTSHRCRPAPSQSGQTGGWGGERTRPETGGAGPTSWERDSRQIRIRTLFSFFAFTCRPDLLGPSGYKESFHKDFFRSCLSIFTFSYFFCEIKMITSTKSNKYFDMIRNRCYMYRNSAVEVLNSIKMGQR